ncbi:sorting nexin-6 isoform X1 [Adelges cooleyi]|uniref:sorting nexin-6 isoform X1 n=1 Tax=Adelges cooleyi TaxID=133065 RepID=UPI00217F31F8|nr:sorting nexin-6 isoform X1 [Adelges cooleyi]XP_050439175.1 sorting nexin-6 isoform X1 [Adelges cooleyi]
MHSEDLDVEDHSPSDLMNEDLLNEGSNSENVDLSDNSLQVVISDALSEKDRVKFTVLSKTTLPDFQKSEFSVVRQHEEFIWLHDQFEENEDYAGYIIPPAPPRPDFDSSREKLQKLGEGEGTMTKEEFMKMKKELEAEYLATFKKTVAMHEMFLSRLAQHPVFRYDTNFRVFLEYDQDLAVRTKNKKELFEEIMKSLSKTTDEYLLSATVRDVNDFFEQEKNFLIDYYGHLKDATMKSDKMVNKHKDVADCYIKISSCLIQLSTFDHRELDWFLNRFSETLEKLRKVEGRVASDEDLKLSDTLRYYVGDSFAAKRLLYRRLRCLANYEAANRNLEKARAKNKDVHAAETTQQLSCEKFEVMSDKGKEELIDFKARRVSTFNKNLLELAEWEIKHAQHQIDILKTSLEMINSEEKSQQ